MGYHLELMATLGYSRKRYLDGLRRLQPLSELERKAKKARTRANLYTQEELDLGASRGMEIAAKLATLIEDFDQ